jgi:hypothetical protein
MRKRKFSFQPYLEHQSVDINEHLGVKNDDVCVPKTKCRCWWGWGGGEWKDEHLERGGLDPLFILTLWPGTPYCFHLRGGVERHGPSTSAQPPLY